MAAIHFISGLPRSGSTLLAALLRQNPNFEAGMSGPLASLFGALLDQMSARNEYSVFIDDAKRQRILHGLFDNYYADCTAGVVFDTNRAWCAWMPAIARLFPDAKVIACVRDLPWVVDSIERLVQRNVFSPSSIFNYSSGGTVYTRANGVVGPDGMVGAPYDALKQACYGAQKDRLLLVQYETLTTDPTKANARHLQLHRRAGFRARLRTCRLRRHRLRRTCRYSGPAHRAPHGQGRAARELAATGLVQPFRQRRLLARSAECSGRSASRLRSCPEGATVRHSTRLD